MSKEKTDIDMDEVHKIESDIEESERISEDEDDNPKKSKKHVNKKPVTSPIKSLAVKRSSNNLSENDSNKATVKKQKTQLPAIFSKVKIFIPNECENCDKLKRYIIA
jgi:hypothetical protein